LKAATKSSKAFCPPRQSPNERDAMKNKLLQLLADNKRAGKPTASKIVAATSANDEAQIYLYDPIVGDRMTADYFGCVCAQDLVPEIDGIIAGTIRLRINCPGGDVFAMQAIMNALRNQKAKTIAQVDGVCASAATGIASVCDETIMEPGSLYMIHNSQGLCYGDKNDMMEMAALQEQVDAGMVEAYAAKTGKTPAEIMAWMDSETWFKAEQAVEAGFANSVNKPDRSVQAAACWNLSAFANAPQAEIQYITDEHRERQQQRLKYALR
jgi:ATP-dependent Clp protease, protease subunit